MSQDSKTTLKNNYNYNPFSGVFAEDLDQIVVPRFDLDDISCKINSSQSVAIEFVGKQGRGKTTNLLYLQNQMKQYPIFLLDENSSVSELIQENSVVIFVDSIHHLNVFERIKIFKSKKTIIYTTHRTRKLECLLIGKQIYSVKFKGIDIKILREIISKRLLLARKNTMNQLSLDPFSDNELNKLIGRFKDDYRGIINYLFDKYQ